MVYGFLTIKNNLCKDKKYYHCAHDDIEKNHPSFILPMSLYQGCGIVSLPQDVPS